ncbi:anti-phage dCTP deaminase [Brevundimonas nasdae]|uniref:CMP/dCMP-type deaminase domain-containing protein n=1 Tax=Brevundimonas nasdae TaxID=172043 RepID=A0ABX8TDF2_9CAUL|nr:anti-phage dCTP deaminase [Brevundimonas nasdae]QYC09191.1 hypothetical protein KWG56_11260 [Brevundimonas nasdae]QYC15240.1 hypothetical protein KWG63_06590 [Brevundimonas nasdae]
MPQAVISKPKSANDSAEIAGDLSPLSKEIFIGLVGYAGSGCSTAGKRLKVFLEDSGYLVHRVRLSELILESYPESGAMQPIEGPKEGIMKLERAVLLQDLGDDLRGKYGNYAVASLGVRRIRELRGQAEPGNEKIAYVIDSIKHRSEVEFLRDVYGQAFRLIAIHGERSARERRLIGQLASPAKYRGASELSVRSYMDRDEKDGVNKSGQEVRDAFYLADYFLDNNTGAADGTSLNADVERFVNLMLGAGLVRPTAGERAMNYAHAAALQSSCLSRQVGAVLVSSSGEIIGTGTNDVPAFGGGVYGEDSTQDHRCHAWLWDPANEKFRGCHNDRKKDQLRTKIAGWIADKFSDELALIAHPKPAVGSDTADRARKFSAKDFREYFLSQGSALSELPGVKELIEYSRAIHAEMNAILSAARSGNSPTASSLYCTTYPCHNCARHLVSAGVSRVFYVEPYVKSLAIELHSDAISNAELGVTERQQKMIILPFTGVGPRMYEDFFTKRVALKGPGGVYVSPEATVPSQSVRLREMANVEERAAALVPTM